MRGAAAGALIGTSLALFLVSTSVGRGKVGWLGGMEGVGEGMWGTVAMLGRATNARTDLQGWQDLFPQRAVSAGAAKTKPHHTSSLVLNDNIHVPGMDEVELGRGDMAKPAGDWGAWRTPQNSNQFKGMTEPVHNDNPFGENIVGQMSDRKVNASLALHEGAFSPITNIFNGNGPLPQMFRSADINVRCDDEGVDCDPVRANQPMTKETTEEYRERMGKTSPLYHLQLPSDKDKYVDCSDPGEKARNPWCDPARSRYGRAMQEGGFPVDSTIAESRLHYRHLWHPRSDEEFWGNKSFFVYPDGRVVMRYPVKTNGSFYQSPPKPDGPGAIRVPFTGTGHYGGLTGPPYHTQEGPPGGEAGVSVFQYGAGQKLDGLADTQLPAQVREECQKSAHFVDEGHDDDDFTK